MIATSMMPSLSTRRLSMQLSDTKKIRLNVTIDDVSPHTRSSIVPVLEYKKMLPGKKITLFIPTAHWRTVRQEVATQYPLRLSQNEQFCQQLLDLPSVLFECAYHGEFHGRPFISDNDELMGLNYDEACAKFESMLNEVKLAGLEKRMTMIIRPPAWRMSAAAIRAARSFGFALALIDVDYAKETYAGEDELENDVIYSNLVYPQNDVTKIDCDSSICYHASNWDKGLLSQQALEQLTTVLNRDNVQTVHMSELLAEKKKKSYELS